MDLQAPKFLAAFTAADATALDSIILRGELLLVEFIPSAELKTKSGLVMASAPDKLQVDGVEMNKPRLVRVLKVGPGYLDEDTGKEVPLESKPGDICMVGRQSVNWLSAFGPIVCTQDMSVGYMREADILIRWPGQDGYTKYMAAIGVAL